jgi:hypothetical protein
VPQSRCFEGCFARLTRDSILLSNDTFDKMAPVGGAGLSAARAQYAGPIGMKGLLANGKTTAIACFAALGGFVYGYNQGMFGQILTMTSFTRHVRTYNRPNSSG